MENSFQIETLDTNTKDLNFLQQILIEQIFKSKSMSCTSCKKIEKWGHRCFRNKKGHILNFLRFADDEISFLLQNEKINKTEARLLTKMFMENLIDIPHERLSNWIKERPFENRQPYLLRERI